MKSNILMKNGIITGQKKETEKKLKHFVAYSCKKLGKNLSVKFIGFWFWFGVFLECKSLIA